jgi:hypothetical protein
LLHMDSLGHVFLDLCPSRNIPSYKPLMYEDKLTYLGCFDLNNFSAFFKTSFYWNPKFTKHHHFSIVPNRLGNIMFNHSSFCFKRSHMLFNFVSRLILIVILLNYIPKQSWSMSNIYCGILWIINKIVT